MPYKRAGKSVMVKRGKKWVKKGASASTSKAKKYLRLLNMVEHGVKLNNRRVGR
jgi:hypothetical protein